MYQRQLMMGPLRQQFWGELRASAGSMNDGGLSAITQNALRQMEERRPSVCTILENELRYRSALTLGGEDSYGARRYLSRALGLSELGSNNPHPSRLVPYDLCKLMRD
jgi:hypothetical protein